MADGASDKPQRSAADKERSRQMNRQVSAREAARTPGRSNRPQGRPGGQGNQGGRGQGGRGQGGRGQGGRGQGADGRGAGGRGSQQAVGRSPARSGARPGRSAAGRSSRRPRRLAAKRSRTGLYTWGAIALVVVVVVVVVVVSQSGKGTSDVIYTPQPVPATILDEITHVPASSYNAVGTGISGDLTLPTVESGQPKLAFTGKPGVFGLFGEYCPYCAAERWSIITSLSRFGTFTGIKTMQSSPIDAYPKTQTFEFATATYTSKYVAAKLLEMYGQEKATGARPVIHKPTKAETELLKKYDSSSTTSSGGTIPFFDIGNHVIFSGSSYVPSILGTLSRATIAAGLSNPKGTVTKLILGTSNYISAGICSIDGGKPGAVCSSTGVQAAAKALKLSV